MEEDLVDGMMGIYAYDTGCVDSGIHDELLRERVKQEFLTSTEGERKLAVIVRENFLSEQALDYGFTLEDVKNFIEWLSEWMDFDL